MCECGACALCDERAAYEHEQLEEHCECDSCARVRSRYAREAREREAATCGGLSGWGRSALSW